MNLKGKKILITGGGTGGHVMPALAIYQFLKNQGVEDFLYVGGYNGIENKIIPGKNILYKNIWISGFQRGKIIKNSLFPVKLMVSFFQAIFILLKNRPDIIIGTGGYVTGPMVFMASVFGFATMIVEQDIYPGVTTRLLARHVDKVCLAFEKTKEQLKGIPQRKFIFTGNPVRPEIRKMDKIKVRNKLGLEENKKTLLIFGGSQGAQFINKAVLTNLEKLRELDIQVIWQTGNVDEHQVKEEFAASGISGFVEQFIQNMAEVYSAADVVISRAGAISIAEIGAIGIPAILVPYPHAAGDHQKKNAELIQEAGAAIMLTQETKAFEQLLLENVTTLVYDETLNKKMAENWGKIYKANSLELIYEEIRELIKRRE